MKDLVAPITFFTQISILTIHICIVAKISKYPPFKATFLVFTYNFTTDRYYFMQLSDRGHLGPDAKMTVFLMFLKL